MTSSPPQHVVYSDQLVVIDSHAAARRLRYKTAPTLINGSGLTRGRHYSSLEGGRKLMVFWDVICRDMGLPHSNYGDGDFMTSKEVADYLNVCYGTVNNLWTKPGGKFVEGIHFFYVPGARRRRLFLREAVQNAAGVPLAPVVFKPRGRPLDQVRLSPDGSKLVPTQSPATAQVVQSATPADLAAPRSTAANDALAVATDFFYLCAKRYLDEDTSDCTARLRSEYIDAVSRLLGPYFEGYAVHEITRAQSLEVINSILHEYGRPRAKVCLHVLRAIFDKAKDCFGIGSPLLPSDDETTMLDLGPRPFTAIQCQALLAASPDPWRPYFATRFFTGLSDREAHSLRIKSVDLNASLIRVEENFSNRSWTPLPADSHQVRVVPVSRIVRDALSVACSQRDPNEPVFHDRRGDPLPGLSNLADIWKSMLRHCRIAYMRLNSIRHTAPYLWLCSGESPQNVAQWSGYGPDFERMLLVYGKLPGVQSSATNLDRLLLANSASVVAHI